MRSSVQPEKGFEYHLCNWGGGLGIRRSEIVDRASLDINVIQVRTTSVLVNRLFHTGPGCGNTYLDYP